MAKDFDGVHSLPTSSTFITTSLLPEMHCEMTNARVGVNATEGSSSSTVGICLHCGRIVHSCFTEGHCLIKMASSCECCSCCPQQYSFQYFDSIISQSADVAFRQIITNGSLCKLLAWAKAKKQSYKSVGNTDDFPSDLTGIVHTVIRKIHTCGASGSSDPLLQLKSTLPAFCTLNRSVTRAMAAGNANCCLIAQCLYESSSGALQTHTPTERKRASRNKMFNYVNQSNHLTAANESYND